MARRPLTKERVLRAAVELADRDGLDALSMRRLGHELRVEAMSLYNHVANKNAILAGIVELVVGEIELPANAGGWRTAIRTCALSAHETLLRHPWACSLILSAPGISTARIGYMNWLLGQFREAGFPADLTYHGYHAVDGHIFGFTHWELGHNAIDSADVAAFVTDFLPTLPPDEYPYFLEHVQQHLDGGLGGNAFELGLDLIVDGLERLRKTA